MYGSGAKMWRTCRESILITHVITCEAPPTIISTRSTALARHLSGFFFQARDALNEVAEELAYL